MTPEQMAAKLRELGGPKGLKRAITNGMKRGLGKGKAAGLKALRSSGVGRALWQKRGSGTAPLIITVGKVRQSGNDYTGSLQEKGMAAIIQKGGRTKRHKEQRAGERSWFHPGSRIPANPHLEQAAAVAGAAIPVEIEIGVGEAIQSIEFGS